MVHRSVVTALPPFLDLLVPGSLLRPAKVTRSLVLTLNRLLVLELELCSCSAVAVALPPHSSTVRLLNVTLGLSCSLLVTEAALLLLLLVVRCLVRARSLLLCL